MFDFSDQRNEETRYEYLNASWREASTCSKPGLSRIPPSLALFFYEGVVMGLWFFGGGIQGVYPPSGAPMGTMGGQGCPGHILVRYSQFYLHRTVATPTFGYTNLRRGRCDKS